MPNEKTDLQSRMKKLRQQVIYYKDNDTLTKLYNKTAFYRKTAGLLQNGKAADFEIVCVDIEKFSFVNALYGIETGDSILRYLAYNLKRNFREPDCVIGRIGGDIFAVCLPCNMQQKILDVVFRIFAKAPLPMKLVPAVGICPAEEETPVSFLCDWAVMSLRSIKRNYFRHVAFFNDSVRQKMMQEQELLSGAEAALNNGEFKLYFQPKCNMNNGKIAGAEVLIRWQRPEKGIVMPSVFIPLFERNGFIEKLDSYIWEETVKWLKTRMQTRETVVPVSVNISRTDIANMDVYSVLTGLVEKYAVSPQLLELEITESAYIDKSEEIINLSARLMDYGFIVLIDDFGSGYSSLNILKDIKANILKIDMRFLESGNKKGKDIIQSVVYMGRWLNMLIITEGVEKQEQVDFLRKIGCTYAQGFFYYHPMKAENFEKLIDTSRKIDYAINNYLDDEEYVPIDIAGLIHENMLGGQLLEKIIGALAIYSYKKGSLSLLQSNEEYCYIVEKNDLGTGAGADIIKLLNDEERDRIKYSIKRVLLVKEPVDMIISIKNNRNEMCWFKIRLFTVEDLYRRNFCYISIFDITESMQRAVKNNK